MRKAISTAGPHCQNDVLASPHWFGYDLISTSLGKRAWKTHRFAIQDVIVQEHLNILSVGRCSRHYTGFEPPNR